MATILSTFTGTLLADTRTRPGTIVLPRISDIPYRVISFKDVYGTFSNSTLTLSTTAGNTFEDSTTTVILSNAYSFYNLYAASTKWVLLNGTQTQVQSISTLNVNSLNIGNGVGWVNLGPIQTIAVSSIQANIQNLYANCNYFGNVSAQTALQFNGLNGTFNNTVIAEQSTGAGVQELLLYKVSSVSDRIRLQTTGNIIFESGVSARSWPTSISNVTPAMIINTSSNVGIQTASPQTTLDVAGTGRFLLLSSFGLNISSINGQRPIGLSSLVSTFQNLAVAGYVSTSQLTSTVAGLGTAGYISSASLFSSIDSAISSFSTAFGPGGITLGNITSTVAGLGTAGYLSTTDSFQISTGALYVSSILAQEPQNLNIEAGNLYLTGGSFIIMSTVNSVNINAPQGLYVNSSDTDSAAVFLSTIFFGGSGGIGELYTDPTYTNLFWNGSQLNNQSGAGVTTADLTSTVQGLGTAGYISTAGGGITLTNLISTVEGLGTAGYLSSLTGFQASTGFVQASSINLIDINSNTVNLLAVSSGVLTLNGQGITGGGGGGGSGDVTKANLVSTVEGLGTAGYLSSLTGFTASTGSLTVSSIFNPDTVSLVGESNLILSTTGFVKMNTQQGLFILKDEFNGAPIALSSILFVGDGGSGELYTDPTYTNLFWNGSQLNNQSGAGVTTANLVSTVEGLGTAGYISSLSTFYLSTGAIQASTLNLMDINSNTINLLAVSSGVLTLNGQGITGGGGGGGSGDVTSAQLISTVEGLGTAGYVSTLSLFSSIDSAISSFSSALGAVGGGGLTIENLTSTVSGLGQAGYLSTLPTVLRISTLLVSTISTNALFASTIITNLLIASTVSTQRNFASSIFTTIINFGDGTQSGYLLMPDIYPNTVYTSTVTTSNLYVGFSSIQNAVQFYGLTGAFNNTVVAEVSTGATTQELLLFKGSNSADRIRMQTTGTIVFEPGVSARLWNSNLSNAVPAMIITTASNVGIQTAAPAVPLDVTGTARATLLSTIRLDTSLITNSPTIWNPILLSNTTVNSNLFISTNLNVRASTFIGGLVSTSFLFGNINQILLNTSGINRVFITSTGFVGINLSSPNFLLDVAGTGEFSTVFASSFVSYLSISTPIFQGSSMIGNSVLGRAVQSITLSSGNTASSTFTGRWNDAQYYVLQTI